MLGQNLVKIVVFFKETRINGGEDRDRGLFVTRQKIGTFTQKRLVTYIYLSMLYITKRGLEKVNRITKNSKHS